MCLYKCYKNLNISPFFESITLFPNKEITILLILSTYRNINEVVPIYNPPIHAERMVLLTVFKDESQAVVAHAFNPITGEAEAGGFL